jgi:hypothetical protein
MVMQQNHQILKDRLDRCFNLVQSTKDIRVKSSLWKFYTICMITWRELDIEMVECRYRKKVTSKYKSLEAELIKSINHFEQWSTIALLKFDNVDCN